MTTATYGKLYIAAGWIGFLVAMVGDMFMQKDPMDVLVMMLYSIFVFTVGTRYETLAWREEQE